MKNKILIISAFSSAILLMSGQLTLAQADSKNATNNAVQVITQSKEDLLIKKEIAQMQTELAAVNATLSSKDDAELKKTARAMHRHWLSFENMVRNLYPLLYVDVEKYETPIFYGSQRDPIDFEALKVHTTGLDKSLNALMNAKETKQETSVLLQQSLDKYHAYVVEQVDFLLKETLVFAEAIKERDLDKAKEYYVISRVFYERIEPIAESFGDLDPRIDARIADIEEGQEWTGFHPLERSLWETGALTETDDLLADLLIEDINLLKKEVAGLKLTEQAMVAGAMELLNEAASTKITGEEEAYSHTDLDDFYANVEGSKAVFLAILPALNVAHKDLVDQLDKQFIVMEEALNLHRKGNSFVAYTNLTTAEIRVLANELTKLGDLMKETGRLF